MTLTLGFVGLEGVVELDVLYQVVDRGIDLAQAIVQCCCMACRCCAKLVTKSWRVSAGSGKWLAWRRVEMKVHVEIVHPVGKLSDIVGSDVLGRKLEQWKLPRCGKAHRNPLHTSASL